jgi:hypothetical protein
MLGLSILSSTALPAHAAEPGQLWTDFNHYVLIARPELAADAANALLQVENTALLQAVEASDYQNPTATFDRAAGMEQVSSVAAQLAQKVEQARIDRSREEQRIADNIQLLSQGQRPYANAIGRLRAAGQYAAPQLLAVLEDDKQSMLHPFVLRAMVDVGRPLVAPLSTALPQLDPVEKGLVAQVLAEIGYPESLPALKAVLEDPSLDASVRPRIAKAVEVIEGGSKLPVGKSAADLYLTLGRGQYISNPSELPGFDAANDAGIVWTYGRRIGLVAVEVPAVAYNDALARRSAESALSIQPDMGDALSLYLASDLRSSLKLGDQADPSRKPGLQPASFYAMLVGPDRLRDVLTLALDLGDAELAKAVMTALASTASDSALQPLERALSYPNAQVRFLAAEGLAKAMPTGDFASAERVVSILGDATRDASKQYALVVSTDENTRNELSSIVTSLGYEPILGADLDDVAETVATLAGVDLMVTAGPADLIASTFERSNTDYKIAGAPVVALVNSTDQKVLNDRYRESGRLATVVGAADAATLEPAVKSAVDSYSTGKPTGEQAEQQALTALSLLEAIAKQPSAYDIQHALPAVIAAAGDARPAIAKQAGNVLAAVNDPAAQSALAESALAGSGDLQLAHLDDLAESARAFGNLLSADAGQQITALVESSQGELALAAARVHGALSLPTSQAVELLLGN